MKSLSMLALLAGPVAAQDVTMVAPIFSQIVAAPLPAGFQLVFEKANPATYILEAVPTGQTVEAWTEMLTLTGAQDKAGAAGVAMGYANLLADGYRAACPDHFVAEALEPPPVPGATELFAAFLGCTAIPGTQAEAMVVLVMAGRRDIYTLQWAARADTTAGPVPYDLNDWTPRLARLAARARICDVVAGEAPPYPSCTVP